MLATTPTNLSRQDMILLAMLDLSGSTSKNLKYEDIVVKLFKLFPEHFQLRGYPNYPDSGDLVHKPLYTTLKTKGYVKAANKIFSLTPLGINTAKHITGDEKDESETSGGRFSRPTLAEIERLKKTEGFKLFTGGQMEDIVETDLYSHLGANVRMSPSEFKGRVSVVESALDESKKQDSLDGMLPKLREYHAFLLKRFEDVLQGFK